MPVIKAHCYFFPLCNYLAISTLDSQMAGTGAKKGKFLMRVLESFVSCDNSSDLGFYSFSFAYTCMQRSNIHNPDGITLLQVGDQGKSV